MRAFVTPSGARRCGTWPTMGALADRTMVTGPRCICKRPASRASLPSTWSVGRIPSVVSCHSRAKPTPQLPRTTSWQKQDQWQRQLERSAASPPARPPKANHTTVASCRIYDTGLASPLSRPLVPFEVLGLIYSGSVATSRWPAHRRTC